jgi:branched-chain amino acid transport system ATP-binding protein
VSGAPATAVSSGAGGPAPAAHAAPLLEVRDITASYGRVQALKPTSLTVKEGELVTILGPNGAGKSTLLRAITRLTPARGQVLFRGRDVSGLATHALAAQGIIMVQEGRGLFGQMTVHENLLLGGYTLAGTGRSVEERLDVVFTLFPRLKERLGQVASSLSGGEQQMLAIGRALMADPKLLMLDEPSLGLAPRVAAEIIGTLGELNRRGLSVLLVEQKAPLALKLAQRVYVISLGRIAAELPANEIQSHHDLARYYLH